VESVRTLFDEIDIAEVTRKEIDYLWKKAISIIQRLNLPDISTRPFMQYCSHLMQREY
jgi:hypothetical protein